MVIFDTVVEATSMFYLKTKGRDTQSGKQSLSRTKGWSAKAYQDKNLPFFIFYFPLYFCS
jgi:hypothetical protein